MTLAVVVEPLASTHDRAAFSSGSPALDRYLQTQAGQDVRRRVSNCFVAIEQGSQALAGFYTLAASGIPMSDLPSDLTRRLPRYPLLPATLIGRLAVDLRFRGQGLGGALLADAMRRSLRADPAVFTLLVDAKDEAAAAFYVRYGFSPLASRPMTLFLPLAAALELLAPSDG